MSRRLVPVLIAAALLLGLGQALAAEPAIDWGLVKLSTVIELKAGHSRLVDLPSPIKRVSVGDDKIADVIVINPRQIYLNGRAVGGTNLSLWLDADKLLGVFELRVRRDLNPLKESLYHHFPQEPIEVRELTGGVVLSGLVSSLEVKAKAAVLAESFAPKKVTNLMEIGQMKQVAIQVRFAEVSRTVVKRLGVNLGFFDSRGNFLFTLINSLVTFKDTAIGVDSFSSKIEFAKNMNAMGGFNFNGNRIVSFLDALKGEGLAKILAEPNLVAVSGGQANFLAGGEFPIPVPQQNNSVTIEFKKFGVQLDFQPEILADGRIKMKVTPEVSELDYTTAVHIEGFAVPGLTSRRAKTEVILADGQSFAIAGLLKDDLDQNVSKVPLLGELPILGTLFRSTDFKTGKTDLVIVVTPRLVKPGETAPARLPTDNFREPEEWALFLLGEMAKQAPPEETKPQPKTFNKKPLERPAAPAGRALPAGLPLGLSQLEGSFGHDWSAK